MNIPHIYKALLLVIIFFACSCNQAPEHKEQPRQITKTYIDQHNGYSEAVVITFEDHKTLYISGQIGEGPDLDSQMRSVLQNLNTVLGKAGAGMDDVVKMNTYIVDYGPETLETFRSVRKELLGDSDMPASTLVGVEALAKKEWLIEIEAIAVIPINTKE